MAKNITIREGDTSKQFTAKKLKMNLVGGGTTNFVPEDEVLDYVNLKDHTFNQSGTFNPSQFNCDGFRQVKIDIPADVKEKAITANGEYNAADDNVLGYSKVTVAVPGGGGGGPFTVRFFDDDRQTILKTDANVPYGGSASCSLLDGTVIGGKYFKGWNPSSTNVKENMNCYPMRGDYIINPNEIQDSWETICEDNGAHYPLGSYKSLVIPIPAIANTELFSWNATDGITWYTDSPYSVNAFELAMHMVKVAEGEDGTTSSWLSTGVIPVIPTWQGGGVARSESYGAAKANGVHYEGGSAVNGLVFDWGTSPYRNYMNTHLIDQFPTALKDAIKSVNKQYTSFARAPIRGASSASSETRVYKTSLDKIWTPSFKELNTWLSSKGNYSSFVASREPTGIDYTLVYAPSYPNSFLTRTLTEGTIFDLNFITVVNNITNYTQNFVGMPFGFCL